MNIATSFCIVSDNPLVVASALREFAGRIERGEVAPGQEGTAQETCNNCNETATVSWEIEEIEDDEGEDEAEAELTPEDILLRAIFGDNVPPGARIVPLA